jgi:hypothetical protein
VSEAQLIAHFVPWRSQVVSYACFKSWLSSLSQDENLHDKVLALSLRLSASTLHVLSHGFTHLSAPHHQALKLEADILNEVDQLIMKVHILSLVYSLNVMQKIQFKEAKLVKRAFKVGGTALSHHVLHRLRTHPLLFRKSFLFRVYLFLWGSLKY